MTVFDPERHPHRRRNPLTGEWVLVSPHRALRPWQGQVEASLPDDRPAFDPNCYLCPGNVRAGGNRNPSYAGTFVFDNDYPALLPVTFGAERCAPATSGPAVEDLAAYGRAPREQELLCHEPEFGRCRVLCFSPRHDLTLARMPLEGLRQVVEAWVTETRELGSAPEVNYVQIFENKGELMGCSNPHPHGQIWANGALPNEPRDEHRSQRDYSGRRGACLLCDYLELELRLGQRVICVNDSFAVVAPFWAVWPFETLLLPRRHACALPEMHDDERWALADILKRLTTRYDNIFNISFPYSMGFHQQPTDGLRHGHWHWHAHFYPPLLRSAAVKKFMVGYEMLSAPQRDLTAETAAARLREMSERHYLDGSRR